MIGWYVHHHGRGHLTRAATILPYLDEPVTVLSSLPVPESHGFADWVHLERDDDVEGVGQVGLDPTAGGALHWAPLNSPGLSRRMAQVADWIAATRPRVVVVDVSVEVTALTRLCGVPVVVFAAPGDREDEAHQLAYRLATAVIAPWPDTVYEPAFLREHRPKTAYVGAMSRFDGRPDVRVERARTGVFVLGGAGGTTLTAAQVAAAEVATGTGWSVAGLSTENWVDDVWDRLLSAEVVVTHAGQNALAEVAAARRPAVVIAQPRPFDEQQRSADALDAAGIAIGRPGWPEPGDWPALLERARALGGEGWSQWSSGHGAQHAAAVIRAAAGPYGDAG